METAVLTKIENFFTRYPIHTYKKGEILIQAEESPKGVIYLKSGTVKQYSISENGDERTLNIYKPHTFFPMLWAMNNTPNRYYFEALDEQVEVHISPRDEVLEFLKNNSDVLFDLTSRIFKGLGGLLAKLEYLMMNNASAKVIFTLLNTAYRFGQKHNDGIEITMHLTHKDLAAMAGVTRETFSREIKKLEEKNLVTIKQHTITIENVNALEEALLLY